MEFAQRLKKAKLAFRADPLLEFCRISTTCTYTKFVADLELKATVGSGDKPQGFPRLSPHAILRCCPVAVAVAVAVVVAVVFAFCPLFVAATGNLGDVSNQAPVVPENIAEAMEAISSLGAQQ